MAQNRKDYQNMTRVQLIRLVESLMNENATLKEGLAARGDAVDTDETDLEKVFEDSLAGGDELEEEEED